MWAVKWRYYHNLLKLEIMDQKKILRLKYHQEGGRFVDYSMNDKLDLNLEGYTGTLNFGDMVNGLSNFKVSVNHMMI